jgi:hypothetical protein
LYFSIIGSHPIKEVETDGLCGTLQKRGNGCEILVGKTEGRRPGGDPRVGRRLILDGFKKKQGSLIRSKEYRLRITEERTPSSTLQLRGRK